MTGDPSLAVPAKVAPHQRRSRQNQLAKRRKAYRYAGGEGVPPWVATNALGMAPLPEMRPRWILQLLKIAMKLTRARMRLTWRMQRARMFGRSTPANSITDYTSLFYSKDSSKPADDVVREWRTDEEFGYQRLNGLCPWFIEKIAALPANFPVTDATLQGVLPAGVTLKQLLDAGRIFLTDQSALDGIPHENAKVMCAPLTLFWLDDTGKLMPLAIQLTPDPARGRIYTPKDPPGAWLSAKVWSNCADLHVHDLFVHTVTFHFVMETMWLAANRCLADKHPLKAFLAPHFAVTTALAGGVRMTISNGGPLASIHALGGDGAWELIRKIYATWSLDELNMPRHFERRGVMDVPGFRFRDDALAFWNCVESYVTGMVGVFYATDADVLGDAEVQAWFREMGDPHAGALKGLPLGPDGRIHTKDALIEVLTAIVFTTGPKHSFIRNSANQYDFFVPNMPAAFHLLPPGPGEDVSVEALAEALPDARKAVLQMALMESIDTPASEFNQLGQYDAGYMEGGGAAAVSVVRGWQQSLKALEAQLLARNETLGGRPYEALVPSQCFNSIWN